MILISSQTDNLVGIAQGFVKSISCAQTLFTLQIDKNLQNVPANSFMTKNHLFRIDKINFRSAITLNYTNLSRLMLPDKRSQELCAFIVDKKQPEFASALCAKDIMKTRSLFKKLNQSQKAAVIKVII